jgi:predicted anti-sigma-YlaC factor YlaD
MSNTTCISDGQLRAKLDGQLDSAELATINAHLATCAHCAQRLADLERDAAIVAGALAESAVAQPSPELALHRFEARHAEALAGSLAPWGLFRRRFAAAWASVAAVIAVAAVFSFTPTRTFAYRLLGLLRVEKVAVIPINEPGGPEGLGNQRAAQMFARVLGDNVSVTQPTKPQPVTDAEAASTAAGFHVRLISQRSDAPALYVKGEEEAQITVDRDRLQAVIDETGRSDLQLPQSLDGATVVVHVPRAVMAFYGKCPMPGASARPHEADLDGENCTMLLQGPSPAVSLPSNVNLTQVAEIGLELTGMSPQEAESICQTIDWTSTLVIPIPRGFSTYEQVDVDGAKGELIRTNARVTSRYALVWVKNGIIYFLGGLGDGSQAVTLASSLE